jgi:hypothetical protein
MLARIMLEQVWRTFDNGLPFSLAKVLRYDIGGRDQHGVGRFHLHAFLRNGSDLAGFRRFLYRNHKQTTCLKDSRTRDHSRLPTVAAAAMALLATTAGTKAAENEQAAVPPPIALKRQNEDEQTPALVLTPPDAGTLIADHSSHSSHSSHYSSSDGGGDGYIPPAPSYTPPVTTPPADVSPPPTQPPPPQAKQLDSVLLNKLAQVPALWPKQVMLIQDFTFTKITDGVAVGLVGAPAGTQVDLVSVNGPKLIVSYMGNRAEIDASVTNIGDLVDEATLVSAPLPTTPATNAAPVATPPTGNSSPQAAPSSLPSGPTGTS